MGACEYKGVFEPDVIKVLLRTTEKDGYCGWSAPAARAVGRFPSTPMASGDGAAALSEPRSFSSSSNAKCHAELASSESPEPSGSLSSACSSIRCFDRSS